MRINLINARKKMDLRQVDMAAYLGITQATYSKYETGDLGLDLETGLKLAELLNVAPHDLLIPDRSSPAFTMEE